MSELNTQSAKEQMYVNIKEAWELAQKDGWTFDEFRSWVESRIPTLMNEVRLMIDEHKGDEGN